MSQRKALVTNILFYITAGVAIILLVAGFFLPPMGVIDPSVIQASGVLAIFALIGQVPNWISAGKSVKFKAGNASIEVNGHRTEENASEVE